jgi:hypothetical protein
MAAGKEGSPVNALVLDAGALIAIDRNDREVHKTVRDAHRMGVQVLTNSMAVAQVWRDSKGRQAELAKVLRGLRVRAVTPDDGRKAGELLEAAGLSDAIDATVALLAETGDPGPHQRSRRPPDAMRGGRAQGRGGSLLT